jgi:multicomponent Na+:H+ antiporter subunit E
MPASSRAERQRPGRPGWQAWLRRIILFAVLWLILTGGSADSWLIGLPVVLVSAWLSLTLWAETPLSVTGILRFAPWFLYQSVAGATDVAFRAMQPRMPLYPGLVRHRLRLPAGASRVMLADVVSMLPGTLSADLEGDELVIHALDTRKDLHAMVEDLEPRIALVFGARLAATGERRSAQ